MSYARAEQLELGCRLPSGFQRALQQALQQTLQQALQQVPATAPASKFQ